MRARARTHAHTRGVVCYKVSLTGHTGGGEGGQVAGQKGERDVLDDLHSTGGSQRGESSDSHANGTQVAQPANHVGGQNSRSLLYGEKENKIFEEKGSLVGDSVPRIPHKMSSSGTTEISNKQVQGKTNSQKDERNLHF